MRGIILGLMLPTIAAGGGGNVHRAWIETSVDAGRLVAVPHIQAAHATTLDYELISAKSGRAGNSDTRQAGSVRIGRGERRSLARLQLGLGDQDQYTLTLRVFEGERLVAEDSATYPTSAPPDSP